MTDKNIKALSTVSIMGTEYISKGVSYEMIVEDGSIYIINNIGRKMSINKESLIEWFGIK